MSSKQLRGDVRISGIINDDEFWAEGEASGDPESGDYTVTLDYNSIPGGWHPHMYTDVKVGLLFLREEHGAKNFLSLARGTYRSAGTIDLGDGNLLKNNTRIEMLNDTTFRAVYVMTGTAHVGELEPIQFFEETMLPVKPGVVAALAVARWRTSNKAEVDGIFATRYLFDDAHLQFPQVRRIEANASVNGKRFHATYKSYVRPVQSITVEKSGPYSGFLIA